MAYDREEPFKLALRVLRQRLRDGQFRPGRRIAAADLAQTLHLSATPVREALSRLAGEGLLDELRGQGFYAPLYTSADVADLYRLSWAHLRISLAPGRTRVAPPPRPKPPGAEDPVEAVERLFADWIVETGSRILTGSYRRAQEQLAPLRRLEPQVFADLAAEAEQLAATGPGAARVEPVRRFHKRRIAAADLLGALLASRATAQRL